MKFFFILIIEYFLRICKCVLSDYRQVEAIGLIYQIIAFIISQICLIHFWMGRNETQLRLLLEEIDLLIVMI